MARHSDDLIELYRLLSAARRHCEVLACGAEQPSVRSEDGLDQASKLGQIFTRLAAAKAELASDMAEALDDQNASAAATSAPRAAARCRRTDRLYRRWLPTPINGRPPANACDVAALDAAEDRLLHRCEQLLASHGSAVLRQSLKRYVPQVEACHAELRRLYPGPPTRVASRRSIRPAVSGLTAQGFETLSPEHSSF